MIPFVIGKRWFVETYIILILFAPFINKALQALNRKQFRLLLVIQFSVFCLWYSFGLSAPLLDDGYGIINFVTLYIIGGYIRQNKDDKILSLNKMHYMVIFTGCAIVTFLLSYFINPYGYAFITNIIGAIAIFLFFIKWDLGIKPGINRVSETGFDVYFIHSDFNTSKLLISELLGAKFIADTFWMIPHILFVVIVVWIMGFMAFKIRKNIFKISIDYWINKAIWINREIEI